MALTVVVHGVFSVRQCLYWPVSVLIVLASDRRGRGATIAEGECRLRHIAGGGDTPWDGRGCLSRHSHIQEAFRVPLLSTAVGGSQYSVCANTHSCRPIFAPSSRRLRHQWKCRHPRRAHTRLSLAFAPPPSLTLPHIISFHFPVPRTKCLVVRAVPVQFRTAVTRRGHPAP